MALENEASGNRKQNDLYMCFNNKFKLLKFNFKKPNTPA